MMPVQTKEIRELLVRACPVEEVAKAIGECPDDVPLNRVTNFSSFMWLGAIVALENYYQIQIKKGDLKELSPDFDIKAIAAMIKKKIKK